MLVGRDYRKRFSQLAAYAVYRYIAVWLIVYACVTYGEFGQAVALGVIAVALRSAQSGPHSNYLANINRGNILEGSAHQSAFLWSLLGAAEKRRTRTFGR